MPDDLRNGLGQPVPRQPFRTIEKLIVAALLVILVGQVVNFRQNQDIQSFQRDGKVRTYQSRAITCDEIKGLGLHEPKACSDPVISAFRDRSTGASTSTGATKSTLTYRAVCDFLAQQVKRDPSFFSLPATCVP